MLNIQEVRSLYPQYSAVADDELAKAFHAKRHPDMAYQDFEKTFLGQYTQENQEELGFFDKAWNTGGAILEGATFIPSDIGNALEDAIWGFDPSDKEEMAEREALEKERLAYRNKYEGKAFEGVPDAMGSAGYSLTTMGAGLLGGVAGSVAGPIGAGAAGMAASGTMAYRATVAEFNRNLHKVSTEVLGHEPTDEEWARIESTFADQATRYGLWEAGPEAVSNLFMVKILGPLGKKITGGIPELIKKVAGLYGEELATETITQIGQSGVEAEIGLRDEALGPVDAFKEIAPATFWQTTLFAGGKKALDTGYNLYSLRKAGKDNSTEDSDAVPSETSDTRADGQPGATVGLKGLLALPEGNQGLLALPEGNQGLLALPEGKRALPEGTGAMPMGMDSTGKDPIPAMQGSNISDPISVAPFLALPAGSGSDDSDNRGGGGGTPSWAGGKSQLSYPHNAIYFGANSSKGDEPSLRSMATQENIPSIDSNGKESSPRMVRVNANSIALEGIPQDLQMEKELEKIGAVAEETDSGIRWRFHVNREHAAREWLNKNFGDATYVPEQELGSGKPGSYGAQVQNSGLRPQQNDGGTGRGASGLISNGQESRDSYGQDAQKERKSGRQIRVKVPNKPELSAQFEVVEAIELAASHIAENGFMQNPFYLLENERRYHDEPASQAKVLENAAKLDATFLMDSVDANHGAPIVDEEGQVLGGNGRAMSVQYAYSAGSRASNAYKKTLIDEAERLGLDPSQVAEMEKPVLIRRVKTGGYTKSQELISSLNDTYTDSKAKRAAGKSRGDRLRPRTLQAIAEGMRNAEVETLREYFSEESSAYTVERLLDDGVIQPAERNAYIGSDGLLNPDGKSFVEAALRGRIAKNYENLALLPADALGKVDAAIPHILAAEHIGGVWDITQNVSDAIDMVVDFKRSGQKDLYTYLHQQNMLLGKAPVETASPITLQILNSMLNMKKAEFTKAFAYYAQQAKISPEAGGLGVGKNQDEAFKQSFGEAYFDTKKAPKEMVVKGQASDSASVPEKASSESVQEDEHGADVDAESIKPRKDEQGNDSTEKEVLQTKPEVAAGTAEKKVVADNSTPKPEKKKTPASQIQESSSALQSVEDSIVVGKIEGEIARALPLGKSGEVRLDKEAIAHIEKEHGKQIRTLGFSSAREFVLYVMKNVSVVYPGSSSRDVAFVVSIKKPWKQTVLKLSFDSNGEFYRVKTAGPVRDGYFKSKKPLWERAQTNLIQKNIPYASTGDLATSDTGQKRLSGKNDTPESGKVKSKIEDFGEKIGGARKDVWTDWRKEMGAVTNDDILTKPLEKVFPEPKYDALLKAGANPKAVALLHAVRDFVAEQKKLLRKRPRLAGEIKALLEGVTSLLDSQENYTHFVDSLRSKTSFPEVMDVAELYDAVGHGKSLAGVRISAGHYSKYNGVEYKPAKLVWVVEKKATKTSLSNWPKELASGETRAEAIENFKKAYTNLDITERTKTKGVTLSVYYYKKNSSEQFIGVKSGKEYVQLAGPFSSSKEAWAYAKDNKAELEEKFNTLKEVPDERRETNNPRVGEDRRNGQDITPEVFADAFGFRGVEFGNWVENDRRQADLNDAYDALMDLSGILDIPPKALSLNGELALAFGARGVPVQKGGIKPSAHYEAGKVVINLTKTKGAGSLAHEWFHAVDNYFSRKNGKGEEYLSDTYTKLNDEGAVRRAVVEAWGKIRAAIKESGLEQRSQDLDKLRKTPYWSENIELGARAFEAYIVEKLQSNNASNDYLVNIVDEQIWEAISNNQHGYPYPSKAEMPAISEAFDNLFQTIETVETDKGVALASLARGNTPVRVVEVDTSIVPEFSKMRDLARWLKDYLSGEPNVTIASTGKTVRFSNNNLEASLKRKREDNHNKAYGALRKLVQQAEFAEFEEADNRHPYLRGQEIYFSAMKMGEKYYAVRLKFDVPSDKEILLRQERLKDTSIEDLRYKDHSLREIEIAPVLYREPALQGGIHAETEATDEIASILHRRLATKVGSAQSIEAISEISLDVLRGAVKPSQLEDGVLSSLIPGEFLTPAKRIFERSIPISKIQKVVDKLTGRSANIAETHVVQSFSDLPSALQKAFRGNEHSLEAVYDPATKTMWMVADNLHSTERVAEVWVHEQVVHHGLRGLFSKAELEGLFNRLWTELGGFANAELREIAKVYGLDPRNNKADRYQVMEEYLASMAEKKKNELLAPKEKTIWQKILEAVRFFMDKIVKKVTTNEASSRHINIDGLLSALGGYVMEGIPAGEIQNTAGWSGSPAFASGVENVESLRAGEQLKKDMEEWGRQIDEYQEGGSETKLIKVCHTPDVYKKLDAPDIDMVMTTGTISKVLSGKEDHGIPKELLKDLPRALAEPIMVFESATSPNSFVVLTDIKHEGRSIMAAIHVDKELQRTRVNDIASAYKRKSEAWYIGQIEEGRLLYQDKKKSLAWARTARLQLPIVRKLPSRLSANRLLTDADIVKPIMPEDSNSNTPLASVAEAGSPESKKIEAARLWEEMGTDSPYFKKWFGKSKVVDKDGKPLMVFHITPATFDSFIVGNSSNFYGKGIYTTTDIEKTSFSNDPTWNMMKLFLRIENPLNYHEKIGAKRLEALKEHLMHWWDNSSKKNGLSADFMVKDNFLWGIDKNTSLGKVLHTLDKITETFGYEINSGPLVHDGVKVDFDGYSYWVAKDPKQVKSVDNQGTFDTEDTRIFASLAKPSSIPDPNKPDFLGKVASMGVKDAAKMANMPPIAHHYGGNDITLLQRLTTLPHWLAKKYPAFAKIYDRQLRRIDECSVAKQKSLESIPSIFGKNRLSAKEMKELAGIMWKYEGKDIPELADVQKIESADKLANGRALIAIHKDFYTAYKKWLDTLPASAKVKQAMLEIRKSLDADLIMAYNRMAEMHEMSEDSIKLLRSNIGMQPNYFPHHRYGKYYVQAKIGNEVVYREHFDAATDALAQRKAREIQKGLLAKYPDAKWSDGKNKKLSEDIYGAPIDTEAMEQIIKAAAAKIPDKEQAKQIIESLSLAVADTMKARGWGSHSIGRKGVPGFEQEDIARVLYDYKSGLQGWLTKMDAARDFTKALGEIDAKKDPGLWSYAAKYVEDMLRNSDNIDRITGNIKSVAFVWYLGGNLKTAVVNATQNIIVGVPRLRMDVKGATAEWITAAGDAIVNQVTGSKGKGLTEEEYRLIQELHGESVITAAYLEEVKSQMRGVSGANVWNKLTNFMGWPMAQVEQHNRASLAIAAFRAAREGKLKDSARKRLGIKGEKASYEEAKAFAEGVVRDAHYVYGKSNTPEWLRGSALARSLSPIFTFRSFSFNMLNMWAWALRTQGKEGMKFAASSIAATMTLGGLTALPFYATLMALAQAISGDDDDWTEVIRQSLPEVDWVRDVACYGLPAIAGVNIGGSLKMETPMTDPLKKGGTPKEVFWGAMGDMIGIPYSMLENIFKSMEAADKGNTYRMIEEASPVAVKNAMQAWRLFTEGQTTMSGRPINTPGQQGARKLTEAESVGKALGFQPVSSTKSYEAYAAENHADMVRSQKIDELTVLSLKTFDTGDPAGRLAMRRKLQEWNDKMTKEGKLHMRIKEADVQRRVKSRRRENTRNAKSIQKGERAASVWGLTG